MAQLTITLRRDEDSGRPVILVGLRSSVDTLPQEHEALHRQLVGRLCPTGGVVARERPVKDPVVG